MLRRSVQWRKITEVATRLHADPNAPYNKRYSVLRKMTLSNTFNAVTEENRYLNLQILLEQLSEHVGRRQYKMHSDLKAKCFDLLKQEQLDWFDLKQLRHDDLLDVVGDGLLRLSHAERAVLLTATSAKVCGVLKQSSSKHSEQLCMNKGKREHGWRCGRHGHTADVYFEGKLKANSVALQIHRRTAASVQRTREHRGVPVEVRSMPDFTVAGRLQHQPNPRIWSSPTNAAFDVSVIGIEFRVHPSDPRARPQIVDVANEWDQHAEVVKHVLWEMLEIYGVERERQPLEISPGELGEPDAVNQYTSAFNRRRRAPAAAAGQEAVHNDSTNSATIDPDDVVIEQRMADGNGKEHMWFLPPLPQKFSNGVPEILPYSPTFIVKSTFRAISRPITVDGDVTRELLQPVMDITCLAHPDACYWMSPEDEEKAMQHITAYARKIPFAIPFNLYLRVDLSKDLKGEEGELFAQRRERLREAKRKYFDTSKFIEFHANEEAQARDEHMEGEERNRESGGVGMGDNDSPDRRDGRGEHTPGTTTIDVSSDEDDASASSAVELENDAEWSEEAGTGADGRLERNRGNDGTHRRFADYNKGIHEPKDASARNDDVNPEGWE